MIQLDPGFLISLAGACAVLLAGSIVRLLSLRSDASDFASVRRRSLIVWWVLLLSLSVALAGGSLGLSVLFCIVGLVALLEFHRLFGRSAIGPVSLFWVVVVLGIGHYLLMVFTDSLWPLAFFPMLALFSISATQILTVGIGGYLRATAGYFWASMLFFWGLSHCVALLHLPVRESDHGDWTAVGAAGWPLLVVLLTETDDIAQALVGRRWGRHKMVPAISPGKSWEGFWGGLLATTVLSIVLTPWLTTLAVGRTTGAGLLVAIGAGVVVSVAGFLGDLNISALKREAGVKDSGTLLPGMGGMIDRIDSLSFTASAFYYYAVACAY